MFLALQRLINNCAPIYSVQTIRMHLGRRTEIGSPRAGRLPNGLQKNRKTKNINNTGFSINKHIAHRIVVTRLFARIHVFTAIRAFVILEVLRVSLLLLFYNAINSNKYKITVTLYMRRHLYTIWAMSNYDVLPGGTGPPPERRGTFFIHSEYSCEIFSICRSIQKWPFFRGLFHCNTIIIHFVSFTLRDNLKPTFTSIPFRNSSNTVTQPKRQYRRYKYTSIILVL